MAEPRTCTTCGQELPAPAGYRTAAAREPAPAIRRERPARPVLEEEYEEAKANQDGWAVAAAVFWCIALIAVAVSARTPNDGLNVFGGGCATTAAVCLGGLIRCRATIRAWRDQKRAGGAGC